MSDHPPLFRLSRVLAFLCLLAMLLIPLTLAALWWQLDWLIANAPEFQQLPIDPTRIGLGVKLLGFGVSMVSSSFILYGLHRLRIVFQLFASGETFSRETASGIRAFALMVVVGAIVRPFATALLTVLLTMGNQPGSRMLSLGFGSGELQAIFVGLVFFAIAHVMAEGQRIADENAQIV